MMKSTEPQYRLLSRVDISLPRRGGVSWGSLLKVSQTRIVLFSKEDYKPNTRVSLQFRFQTDDGKEAKETADAIVTWQCGNNAGLDFDPPFASDRPTSLLGRYLLKRSDAALDGAHSKVLVQPTAPLPAPSKGMETVLLVEDEEMQRTVFRKTLEKSGYTVLEARFNSEAFMLYKRNMDTIRLIVTDVMMPGISGRELAEPLRSTRPDLRIVYMSSSPHPELLRYRVLSEDMPFLQKPFSPDILTRKVREVLGAH